MPYSQNGYSANDRSKIATYTVPGTQQRIPIRKGTVATVLLYVASRFNREVERLHLGWSWGYAERTIRGSSTTLSNHASGTAIDLNAPAHPLGTDPAANYSATEVRAIQRILRDCRGVVRWGGNYSGRKDGMHFEIVGSQAEVDSLAARIKSPAPAPKPAKGESANRTKVRALQALLEAPTAQRDGLWGPNTDGRAQRMAAVARDAGNHAAINRRLSRGAVALVQRIADVNPDGIFGPVSERGVRAWTKSAQRLLGVSADGIWGARTQAAYDAFRRANLNRF